jgi:prepilin-type N-terminal cleavage/methylation domain-containing protein
MNRKGFTLIELLIVVVIIGILAAIAIPKFANTKDKAKIASMKSDLRNLVSAQEGHFADFATYATGNDITNACIANTTTVCFAPTLGNTLTICGVFGGNAAAPNAAVLQEGAPACW